MKLSTAILKQRISEWLSDPTLHDNVVDSVDTGASLRKILGDWGNPHGVSTMDQLKDHVWSLWKDGNQWKRGEKRRLGESWEDYFGHSGDDEFMLDFCGSSDKQLVDEFKGDASRCWLRVFYPDNELADNYRLELVTTPADDKIVGWTVIVD